MMVRSEFEAEFRLFLERSTAEKRSCLIWRRTRIADPIVCRSAARPRKGIEVMCDTRTKCSVLEVNAGANCWTKGLAG
jgi:hypothetical protein